MSRMQASTINQIGQRPLHVLPQLSGPMLAAMQHRARRYGIGDGATDAMASGLMSPGDVATAQTLGASDAQLEAVAQGTLTSAQLFQMLPGGVAPVPIPAALVGVPGVIGPTGPTGVMPTGVTAVTPASTTVATSGVLPAGTELMYQVSWASSVTNLYTPSMISSSITAQLQANQITILNETDAPSSLMGQGLGFTLTVSLGTAYATAAQVKAIIDAAITAAGRSIVSSNISVIGVAGSATAMTAAGATIAATSFLTNNAGSIAGLLVLLVLGPVLLRKL